jgi:hypothetical protein
MTKHGLGHSSWWWSVHIFVLEPTLYMLPLEYLGSLGDYTLIHVYAWAEQILKSSLSKWKWGRRQVLENLCVETLAMFLYGKLHFFSFIVMLILLS